MKQTKPDWTLLPYSYTLWRAMPIACHLILCQLKKLKYLVQFVVVRPKNGPHPGRKR